MTLGVKVGTHERRQAVADDPRDGDTVAENKLYELTDGDGWS